MNVTLHDLLAIIGESRVPSHTGQYTVISAAKMRAAIIARLDAYDVAAYRGLVGASIYDKITYLPGRYIEGLQYTLDPLSTDTNLLRVAVDDEGVITQIIGFGRPGWP